MVSESTPPRRPVLTLDELAAPLTRRPERLHALTAADLAIAFSQGLDLAEGKPPGHAQRVCYIATMLADALDVEPAQRAGVFFGALLHDIGVTPAAADICRVAGVDEEVDLRPVAAARARSEPRGSRVFADIAAITDAVHQHCILGAETARALELPEEAAVAIAGHHERWDGTASRMALPAATIADRGAHRRGRRRRGSGHRRRDELAGGAAALRASHRRVRRPFARSRHRADAASSSRGATSSGSGCTPKTWRRR